MPILYILLGVLGLAVIYVFATYNKFQTLKTRIEASVQEIGNQLKRQAEMIPNLVSSVKGYMKHESKIFSDLTEARKMIVSSLQSGDAAKMVEASQTAAQALAPIRAVFESTPELQAAGPTSKLMDELRDTADKIMYSRRTLIDLTADYNVLIVTLPSSFIANIFGFKKEKGLQMAAEAAADVTTVKQEETKTPEVKLE